MMNYSSDNKKERWTVSLTHKGTKPGVRQRQHSGWAALQTKTQTEYISRQFHLKRNKRRVMKRLSISSHVTLAHLEILLRKEKGENSGEKRAYFLCLTAFSRWINGWCVSTGLGNDRSMNKARGGHMLSSEWQRAADRQRNGRIRLTSE